MAKIFVILDYYLPGYRAGGPLRTVANIVDQLSDQFEFSILTRDRDIADSTPYTEVVINSWTQLGKAMVYHASADFLSLGNIQRVIREVSPDIIYLNSFFSPLTRKCLLLRRLGFLSRIPVILAPRGELSPGALGLKAVKKRIYLALVRILGLYRDLFWHASSALEKREIQQALDRLCDVYIAPNLPTSLNGYPVRKREKMSGEARLVFLSRISPMKNLTQALELLLNLSGKVTFDIYGPIEDKSYWLQCENIIARVPDNVQVNYCGSILPTEVADKLGNYHFFLFPTLGENFGHVILEALAAGCPIMISDKTQWSDLEAKQVGWDLPLDNNDLWQTILQRCVLMDQSSYENLSNNARRFALNWISCSDLENKTVDLFTRALKPQKCVMPQTT